MSETTVQDFDREPYKPLPENPNPKPPQPFCFQAINCNRLIKHGQEVFDFQPYTQVGGCWYGMFVTLKPEQAAALRELAKVDRTIKEITLDEWAKNLKKVKPDQLSGYNPLILQPVPQVSGPIETRPAVFVENPASLPAPVPTVTSDPVKSAADALQIGKV